MRHVDIYTDGACSGNPGKGGWAAVLIYRGIEKEISGAEPETTNNRMELTAILEGLRALKEPCSVNLYSDSAYAVNAFNEGWIRSWAAKGWKKKGEDIKNLDLWQSLVKETQKHNVAFIKVKGHSDNIYNNRCDALARAAIKTLIPLKKEDA